jgi:uncharacterized protein
VVRGACGGNLIIPRAIASIGVISDTHGLLRPEAIAALAGAQHIVHAGDIGGSEILQSLAQIAPVVAVRGNMDRDYWAGSLPLTAELRVGGARLCILHDRSRYVGDPKDDGYRVVIAGHTHEPLNEWRDGVLHFNPGSAGPCRSQTPVSVGRLQISGRAIVGEIIRLRVVPPG